MGAKSYTLVASLVFLLAYVSSHQHILSYFNQNGVDGTISFGEDTADSTNLTVTLSLGSSQWSWAVMEFPVNLLQTDPCANEQLGQRIYNLTEVNGKLTGNETSQHSLALGLTSGDNAILGRSILLINDNGDRVCATIQGDEQVSYTVLNGEAVGHIYFRKIGERVAMFADLSSAINAATTDNYRVELMSGSIIADQPSSTVRHNANERCETIMDGMVVAEITDVSVAEDGQTAKSYKLFAPTGNVEVVRMTIGDTRICSGVHLYETRKVSAVFSEKGVSGTISFTQDNPFAPTAIHVNLTGFATNATQYHVHEFPVPYKFDTSNRCGLTGAHFMPFGGGMGPSQNKYEIGDLSGKHGFLHGLQSLDIMYMDHYLPLFGRYSIAGRSIVIHTATQRWLCSNIGYPGPITVAIARFDAHAVGTITMIQEKDKPWGDTTIHVAMSNSGFGATPTEMHNYHVHETPVGDDLLLDIDTGRCSSAGDHWNPFIVDVLDPSYPARCAAKLSRCEIGDFSGKFGTIDLAGDNGAIQVMNTDVNVALSSPYTVIGRSITIHVPNKGAGRYSCANIVEKLQAHARTSVSWTGADDSQITGDMKFSETKATGITEFYANMEGLDNGAGGYHVHELPLLVANPGSNICGTTSGHFNPFGAEEPWVPVTHDGREVGDLSRKFGTFDGLDALGPKTNIDTNLPVSGYQSIVGRSVVIHRPDGARLTCADVDFDAEAMGGKIIQGVVNFTGDITGGIVLSQVITENGVSDVSIHVEVENADGTSTEGHGWHVHISPVENGDCASTDGHYNPFNADVGDDQYLVKCSPLTSSAQDYCEVGDLSGKFGSLAITNGQRLIANDHGISLVGPYSVMGRSIVIHAKDGASPRIVCGDIKPLYPEAVSVKFEVKDSSVDGREKTVLADSLRNYLQAERGSVYVDKLSSSSDDDVCDQFIVYFSGLNAETSKSKFQDAVANDALENIHLCSSASASMHTNFSLALLTILISVLLI